MDKSAEIEIRLTKFLAEQINHAQTYFGYPEIPKNNDLSILGVSGLAKLHLNNAGDPYVQGNSKMHTKIFEQEAIAFVADLYRLTDYWGYITSGGTEGNLYGMYMGRDYFHVRGKTPMFLYSESSHYSIPKNAHLLNMHKETIASDATGEMDYADLHAKLVDIVQHRKDVGFVINLNIGTTMTGAMDELSKVYDVIDAVGIVRNDVFVHADCALMGFIYPFLEDSVDMFALGLNSMAISGHKFPGTIHPCGVFITQKAMHDYTFKDSSWVSYIGTNDSTISGSRNGFLALNFWYIIQKKGKAGFKHDAKTCIANATYLYEKLQSIGCTGVGYNRNQIIVTFDKPSDAIVQKYQLATENNKAHIVVMQHITQEGIDAFCDDLLAI